MRAGLELRLIQRGCCFTLRFQILSAIGAGRGEGAGGAGGGDWNDFFALESKMHCCSAPCGDHRAFCLKLETKKRAA